MKADTQKTTEFEYLLNALTTNVNIYAETLNSINNKLQKINYYAEPAEPAATDKVIEAVSVIEQLTSLNSAFTTMNERLTTTLRHVNTLI